MRSATFLTFMGVLAFGCGTNEPAMGRPSPTGPLTPAEREQARGVPSYGDVSITLDDDVGRAYVGSATIQVTSGTIEGTMIVVTAVASGPTEGLTGHLTIPEQLARGLASGGWDFTLVPEQLGVEDNLVGDQLNGTVQSVHMRADSDGMFVMTVALVEAGASRSLVATGRMTGGCAIVDNEGGITRVTDLGTVPQCQSVLGGL